MEFNDKSKFFALQCIQKLCIKDGTPLDFEIESSTHFASNQKV